MTVLQERRDRLREACRRANRTGRLSFQSDLLPHRSLIWAAPLGVVWCPIYKVGGGGRGRVSTVTGRRRKFKVH